METVANRGAVTKHGPVTQLQVVPRKRVKESQ